jgi:hypothetical protein
VKCIQGKVTGYSTLKSPSVQDNPEQTSQVRQNVFVKLKYLTGEQENYDSKKEDGVTSFNRSNACTSCCQTQ